MQTSLPLVRTKHPHSVSLTVTHPLGHATTTTPQAATKVLVVIVTRRTISQPLYRRIHAPEGEARLLFSASFRAGLGRRCLFFGLSTYPDPSQPSGWSGHFQTHFELSRVGFRAMVESKVLRLNRRFQCLPPKGISFFCICLFE